MTWTRKIDRDGERGAAIVEFAITLPPLLLLLLGAIDWGYYFYVREVVTNAARDGARTAAIDKSDAAVNASNYLAAAGLQRSGVSSACTTAQFACVTINYPTGSITGFPPLPSIMPTFAAAEARMRFE